MGCKGGPANVRGEPGREPATVCFVTTCALRLLPGTGRERCPGREKAMYVLEPGGKEEDSIFDPLSIFHP